MSTELRKVGRPTKLTTVFLEVAKRVINQMQNVLIYTDYELLDEINDNLEPADRVISGRSRSGRPGPSA